MKTEQVPKFDSKILIGVDISLKALNNPNPGVGYGSEWGF